MTDKQQLIDRFREYFEANLLDGDKIQGGQMLASSEAFDVCAEFIATAWLEDREAVAKEWNDTLDRAVTEAKYSVIPDLAWCFGKLRGLGHPNDAMEKRYTPYMTIAALTKTKEDKPNE